MFENKKILLLGIGGVSMSSIAGLLQSFNCTITGYDSRITNTTKELNEKGIETTDLFNEEFVNNADYIVYSAAIPEKNEYIKYARKINKPLYERSEFLGLLMKEYENVLCISGTHGKSSTTAMIATIFVKNNMDPTIHIGANLPLINGNYKAGSKKYFITESCEFVDTFLKFYPTSEIILNIDDDHLDYFGNVENAIKSFNKFTHLLKDNEYVIVNNDDENSLKAVSDRKSIITFGINKKSDYMAKNITNHHEYDLYIKDEFITHVNLNVLGDQFIIDSLAAIAMSNLYIKDINNIVNAIEKYTGIEGRFELKYKLNDICFYDDYAHHPGEIKTTVATAKILNKKSIAVFQALTYTRTLEHLNEFGKLLSEFDEILVLPIFASREEDIYGIHGQDIVNEIIKNGNNNVKYYETYEEVKDYLLNRFKDYKKDDYIIITVGGGEAFKLYNLL